MIQAPVTQWHCLFRFRWISVIRIICMMLFLFSIAACRNNEQEAKKENTVEDDSLQSVKSIVSEDSIMVFRNKADNWISESIQKTGLNWNRFHLTEFWSEDSLQEKSFQPD